MGKAVCGTTCKKCDKEMEGLIPRIKLSDSNKQIEMNRQKSSIYGWNIAQTLTQDGIINLNKELLLLSWVV